MECLLSYVDKKYHRLIMKNQPKLKVLLGESSKSGESGKTEKPLNGPPMSRDTNESITDSVSSEQIQFCIHFFNRLTPSFAGINDRVQYSSVQ